jgi:DNA-binding response OmpR family regulator
MSKQEKKAEADAKPIKADAKKEDANPGAGKTVLIVEDTTELAEVIQATLERLGITAHHETHAIKALDIYKKEKPDLVLLDIGLPDMSGWKLLDGIKELDKDNLPHFIIITAYGDPANRLMGKLQEVDSYLIKPFSPDEVERVVGKVLGFAKED